MFLIDGHSLFRTLICRRLFQNKVNLHASNFGWPFYRINDNRTTKGGRGNSINSTNEMQNLKESRFGHVRFPTLGVGHVLTL